MSPLTVEIDVLSHSDPPLSPSIDHLADLVQFALESTGASGRWTIAVVQTSDAHLRDLHRRFMGIDEETDVMTFPHDDDANSEDHGGDIVISVERAAEQGSDLGLTIVEEIEFLTVHGVLHLQGWDDATPSLRQAMHTRQSEIIDAFRAERRLRSEKAKSGAS